LSRAEQMPDMDGPLGPEVSPSAAKAGFITVPIGTPEGVPFQGFEHKPDQEIFMKAILMRRTGDPSVLEYAEVPTPRPADNEVLIKAHTIGVGVPETLVRKGVYEWMPPLPFIPGIEMSGTVAELGRNVQSLAAGQPVFISARDLPVRAGCYAEYIAVPAEAAHPLPANCDLEAAACLSNYQVAYHLLHTAARGVEVNSVVVHMAGGGVGSAAVDLARLANMTVIAVVGSEAQARAVEALGAQHTVSYQGDDIANRVRESTGGRGADLILDSIGGKEFGGNFAMVAPMGMVISYGFRKGWPDPSLVAAMRSNFDASPALRIFTMHTFDQRPDIRKATMNALLAHLAAGELQPLIYDRLPLAKASRAHELLESGEVIGKLVMKP
jgi:NADPH2:quinone reductase